MGEEPARQLRRGPRTLAWVAAALVVGYIAWGVGTRQYRASRKATCLSNISQLAKAMRLYSLDYKEYLFFDRGDAFSPPLVPGHYGQGYYLKKIMVPYVPNWGIWYCPADKYAKRDFTRDPSTFGTFNYRRAGIGYTALAHDADSDPGIAALHSELNARYAADPMRLDHNEASYRFIPFHSEAEKVDGAPVYIDNVMRAYDDRRGAYGYWDVNPSSTWIFEEDLAFHFASGGLFRDRIYGTTVGFRDGHAVFHTYDVRGVAWGPSSELNEPF